MSTPKKFDPAAGDDGGLVGGGAPQPGGDEGLATAQPEKTAEEASAIAHTIMKTADASFARRYSGHMATVRCLDAAGGSGGSVGCTLGTFAIVDGVAEIPGECLAEFADASRFQVLG